VPPGTAAVIEIQDNGPLFEPALPDLAGRKLVLRAGKGYRPLLAWDVGAAPAGKPAAGPPRFVALDKGSLALQDLDVVVKWNEGLAGGPAVLLHVKGGDLTALRCTFSVAGQHPQGTTLVWVEGGPTSRCRLSHCYLRGSDLTALHLQGTGADVLLDDCLLAAGGRPLVEARSGEGGPQTLRLVRSTLVGGGSLLDIRPAAGVQQAAGAVNVKCCDSLLAQGDPRVDGTLLQLGDGLQADRLSWKASNTLYAGWKTLLSSAGQNVPASALQLKWWPLWGYQEGDKVLFESWPRAFQAQPEDVPPAAYDPAGTAAAFAALTRPGLVGCDLAALPQGRPLWAARTYDRLDLDPPALPARDAPPIPEAGDGLYHGERVKLTRTTDLGRLLQDKLAGRPPARLVVLQVSGHGEVPTSPIRLRGASLVLSFDKPGPRAEPLILVPAAGAAGQDALIQVDGGDLDLLGVRVELPRALSAGVPRHIVQVRGGSLRLFGCHLHGPLSPGGDGYQGLLDLAGLGPDSGPAPSLAASRCVLLSAGSVLHLGRGVGRLRLHECLAVGPDDLLVADLGGPPPRRGLQLILEHSTLAARRTLLDLRGLPVPEPREPVLIRADASFFVTPFEGASSATLLRCQRDLLTRSLLLWQGKGNAFDRRFPSYLTAAGAPATAAQPFPVWARVWGTPGEQAPLVVDMPRTAFKATPMYLRQLALPATVHPRAGEVRPGANLARLGILGAGP
jgi:hypothetical protein